MLAERLRLQGFTVVECSDGAQGAVLALEEPPAAVVADLSMPSISGVQLCRLLGSEVGTSHVPVILRGAEGRRNHFWAEQAGAVAYVQKGRMGELLRALRKAIEARDADSDSDFFVVASTQGLDVRDRIATHLDAALFDSVIAAEVRRLGTSESFDRLADLLSQFVSQVTTYRWIALLRREPMRLAVHTNAATRGASISEARQVLGLTEETPIVVIEDDDAASDPEGPPPLQEPVRFGEQAIGTFALAPRAAEHKNDHVLVTTIARELGGALRMATLVEESRWMATTDALTGLLNRRAFLDLTGREVGRARRYGEKLSVILLDVDHFKQINDRRGHAAGDMVLSAMGKLLKAAVRNCDIVARWGGEEFVLVLPSTSLAGAEQLADRIRELIEHANIKNGDGDVIPVTASFGVANYTAGETVEQIVDRADRAMYQAKSNGRNRVVCDTTSVTLVSTPLSVAR
ncbi:MAG: two-component system, cell cycle response regulator [Myxococcales bacterium]|nr:two-component system, cell cycle response regulator [Myxococcales bacterium]